MTQELNKKIAQSASAIGALLLGVGLGATWGKSISNTILILTMVTGGVIHIVGMYILQLKTQTVTTGLIAKALYITAWICLVLLVGLFIFLLV